ncbi:Calmodulin and related proteins (EF-Hand superfamily) [Handroanthus impetiginosus]|uniref:Calmodulin and related proteins (EF-Hand superfamily) n=1 Tax=Handroanthus impetiginosus TaxID=429701 RepID=A0A2G9HG03_9LAMI|nr:Calmodulin and related proteins (EF-Hand superfamily) [Handroanthus impetiginosus]
MSPLNTIDLYQIFKNLDKNGDGLVSIDELMWLLERIGIQCKRDELELLVGNKALDAVDFLFFYETLVIKGNNFYQEKCKVEGEDEILENDLRKAFRVFDMNDDGFISSEELQTALSRLGLWDEQDCKHMIVVYDTNKDGLLDFEEFKDMMCA